MDFQSINSNLNSSMNSFNSYANQKLSFFENEYVYVISAFLLLLTAQLYAPKFPPSLIRIARSPLVRGVIFFLIVYLLKKNAGVALVVSVAVVLALMLLSKYTGFEFMEDLPECGCGVECKHGADCNCGPQCPCKKSVHQYAQFEGFAAEEESVKSVVMKQEEKPVVAEEKPSLLDNIKSMISDVLPSSEEKNVKAIIAEEKPVDSVKDVFDEESLSALREKVEHRHQNSEVCGYDKSDNYSSL